MDEEEVGQRGYMWGDSVPQWGPRPVEISSPSSPLSAGIGIGFYGNSETSDGVSQLSSALLHANHTLSTIDHLVRGPATGQTPDPNPDWSPTGTWGPALRLSVRADSGPQPQPQPSLLRTLCQVPSWPQPRPQA